METIEIALAEHPCLKVFNPKYLKVLLNYARSVQFDPDQVIYREGDIVKEFFLIRKGRVALEINIPHGGPIRIETLHDGELLGWSWLMPPCKCQFSARALERTNTIAFDGHALLEKCEEDHEFGYELFCCITDIIVERFHATLLQFLNI